MNYHVLGRSEDNTKWNVVFHIPIPNNPNSAGYSFRQAIVDVGGGTASAVPFITPEEQGLIDTGEVYEIVEQVDVGEGNSIQQQRAEIEVRHAHHVNVTRTDLAKRLDWYGYEGPVT